MLIPNGEKFGLSVDCFRSVSTEVLLQKRTNNRVMAMTRFVFLTFFKSIGNFKCSVRGVKAEV